MLVGVDDIVVVGLAGTGQRAVELTTEVAPDVVLMDLRMPDLDGIEATRRINRTDPATALVVLTMFEDDDSVFAAMRAGARGYLLKGADQDEIVRAIRAAAAGEAIFGPEIAARVISHFARGSGSTASAFPELTDRQPAKATRPSRTSSSSAFRPCETTSRTSTPSCRSPTDRQQSSRPQKQGLPAGPDPSPLGYATLFLEIRQPARREIASYHRP